MPEVMAVCAASAALALSEVPFPKPVACVRVGYIPASLVSGAGSTAESPDDLPLDDLPLDDLDDDELLLDEPRTDAPEWLPEAPRNATPWDPPPAGTRVLSSRACSMPRSFAAP